LFAFNLVVLKPVIDHVCSWNYDSGLFDSSRCSVWTQAFAVPLTTRVPAAFELCAWIIQIKHHYPTDLFILRLSNSYSVLTGQTWTHLRTETGGLTRQ